MGAAFPPSLSNVHDLAALLGQVLYSTVVPTKPAKLFQQKVGGAVCSKTFVKKTIRPLMLSASLVASFLWLRASSKVLTSSLFRFSVCPTAMEPVVAPEASICTPSILNIEPNSGAFGPSLA